MKQPIEKAKSASSAELTRVMASPVLRPPLRREAEATSDEGTGAKKGTEEDAAVDAEDILTQAEEANALDPVG